MTTQYTKTRYQHVFLPARSSAWQDQGRRTKNLSLLRREPDFLKRLILYKDAVTQENLKDLEPHTTLLNVEDLRKGTTLLLLGGKNTSQHSFFYSGFYTNLKGTIGKVKPRGHAQE